jgi:hypothetical protein
MKEELIKELVANSKFTNRINLQYQHKIETLQKETNLYKNEIADLQRQLSANRDPSKIELLINYFYSFFFNITDLKK